MAQDTQHGTVLDEYGSGITVTGDRSGAVLLEMGLIARMLTPQQWDDLDRRVRAAFRPELLAAGDPE